MIRGTTPTVMISTDVDLTAATAVIISFSQRTNSREGIVRVDKELPNITVTSESVSCTLSQVETLSFAVGEIKIQVRAKYPDGSVIASNIMTASVDIALNDEVI